MERFEGLFYLLGGVMVLAAAYMLDELMNSEAKNIAPPGYREINTWTKWGYRLEHRHCWFLLWLAMGYRVSWSQRERGTPLAQKSKWFFSEISAVRFYKSQMKEELP